MPTIVDESGKRYIIYKDTRVALHTKACLKRGTEAKQCTHNLLKESLIYR